MSILINGEPSSFFLPSRGTRQGYPLSPYIFIICMEFLSLLIEHEIWEGNWKPLQIGKSRPRVTQSLFADDIIPFGLEESNTINVVK